MRTKIACFLLLLTLILSPISTILAETVNENNLGSEVDETSRIVDEFDYWVVNQKVNDLCESNQQLALISNNLWYVGITAGLYAFSLIVIIYLMKITPHQAKDLVTTIGLVSVIFGAILLVLVVDTTESLTAPMGILGAIAGYLFGVAQKKSDETKS